VPVVRLLAISRNDPLDDAFLGYGHQVIVLAPAYVQVVEVITSNVTYTEYW
jgi:hypothetical protein